MKRRLYSFPNFLGELKNLPNTQPPFRISNKNASLTAWCKSYNMHMSNNGSSQSYRLSLNLCVFQFSMVTTFSEWLSGTEPLPHTHPCVRPRCVCSVLRAHAKFLHRNPRLPASKASTLSTRPGSPHFVGVAGHLCYKRPPFECAVSSITQNASVLNPEPSPTLSHFRLVGLLVVLGLTTL